MKKITPKAETSTALPKIVKAADLKQGKWEDQIPWRDAEAMGIADARLRLYNVKGLGWVICTLHISNPSRRQSASTTARFYSIGIDDGKVYTVGKGPHVLQEVVVYIDKTNVDRLKPLIELHQKGLADAGQIRDRISSRRAQGALRRGSFGGDMFGSLFR